MRNVHQLQVTWALIVAQARLEREARSMARGPLGVPSGCLKTHGVPQPPLDPGWDIAHASLVPHVAFFDSRVVPDLGAMQRVARMANATSPPHSMQFHAIVSARSAWDAQRNLPGVRVHVLHLSAAASCLYKYLSASSHGPGPQYLQKVILPWILPASVPRNVSLGLARRGPAICGPCDLCGGS